MISISICICTKNRQEGLNNLLNSIDNIQSPPDARIRIIVVENDIQKNSESIVKEFSSKSKFRIDYFLETRLGIAYARNRSVKEADGTDFCCFVDDDQVVTPNWIIELLKCQVEFNSDGVWGPNPPIFEEKVPSYIRQFHTPQVYDYGTIVTKAYTNSLLLRKKYLDMINGPFDTRLNFTGGEDIYLTYLISNMGGVIRYNPNAIAFEIIAGSRTTIKYVIQRTYRNSNTSLYVNSLIHTTFPKLKTLLRLVMRLAKIINAIGGYYFIVGKRNQFYK